MGKIDGSSCRYYIIFIYLAFLYASLGKRHINGCIYDSPFSNLKKLIKELASQRSGLPKFIFSPIISFIEKEVK
jgi:hypothetical protein